MSYIKKDFLLTNKTAQRLYDRYAADTPIFDYHCHLPEAQIDEDAPFDDIYSIWLAGDHYKWRLMRSYGVNERLITGAASHEEKFKAYCNVLSTAFGNPLYHWSQAELEFYFDCELEINGENADEIWRRCNQYIEKNKVTPSSLIQRSNVTHVFTTNEVDTDLTVFARIRANDRGFKVLPTFRADKVLNIEKPGFAQFVKTAGAADLDGFIGYIEDRIKDFVKEGCHAGDLSLGRVYDIDEKTARAAFVKSMRGEPLTECDIAAYKGYMTYVLLARFAKNNICTMLHIGAMRNNNTVMFNRLGPDTGFDSTGDGNCIAELSRLLDRLTVDGTLPRTIIFNLNPKMNSEIMALIGCFQTDDAKGKIQYGPAWWFLDNRYAIEKNLIDLATLGHIATSVGMLTDSRSFLSYRRHHYFRRILCSFFGTLMENGEMTSDDSLVGEVISNICYTNALKYFRGK